MQPIIDRRPRIALSALALAACSATLGAQLPNASPAAAGLSNAYTARARGYDAVAWNPANLGQPGNPKFSIGLLALQGTSGLDPVTLSDIGKYSGKVLPVEQRENWLQSVTNSGGENGRMGGGLTYLGLSTGPVALQVATSITGSAKLNPDAMEAVLFGNAGRTGEARPLAFAGSNVHVAGFTTAGLSYGFDVGEKKHAGDGQLSLGVTAKYILGNVIGVAQDQGSATNSNNVILNFPAVYSHPDSGKVIGNGFGVDLGLAWSRDKLSFGATVQNVLNTFKWDESKLISTPASAVFDGTTNTSDFEEQPYANAPAALRQRVTDDKFKPIIAAGVGYAWKRSITLSADVRQQVGDELLIGPKTSIGGGIDYRWLPILRLRGGASYVTDGWGVSGGAGLQFGRYELGVGVSMLNVNGGQEPGITLNVLSIR
jgi:hypothetical protein